jgi:hypothetical protein
MAAAKKSGKKSSKKSGVKKSTLKSDAKGRKKDKKESADSKVRPKGRADAKKNAKNAKKSTGKGKTAEGKSKPGGKAKQAAAEKSGAAKSVANASSSKAGAEASEDATLEKIAANAAEAAERAATRTDSAPTASRAKAERRPPSGPAPSPRPAVRRSGLETSTPAGAEVPSTVQRSDAHAQATWSAARDSAVEQYGEGERAHRTAFAALKHTYEKVGDHWEAKAEAGPSDSRAASPGPDEGTPAGGVDATASRAHLYRLAQRLDIPGRSSMTKDELVQALQKANVKATAEARGS